MEEVPSKWSVDRVCLWLDGGGLGQLAPIFIKNKIDGKVLMSLTKTDLRDELEIDALSDRKQLWDRLDILQRKKASPVSVPAISPKAAPAGGGYRSVSPMKDLDRCEECFKMFGVADVPVIFKLPGAQRSAQLHSRCKDSWARRNAKPCQQCHKLMVTDITTLTGPFGKAELHPECVRSFENKQRDRVPSSSTPVNFTTGGQGGRCEYCMAKFAPGDTPILLTLPGALRAAELHPHCKQPWAKMHSKKCDQCGEAMPTDITTLSGAFGKAEVHPECVASYETSLQNGVRPSSSSPKPFGSAPPSPSHTAPRTSLPAPPQGKCEHCFRPFESYDKPILLTLPGASRHAELHPHCKTLWSRAHAKKCDFCGEAMITDITTLTGAWGTAELHPGCVSGYEKTKNNATRSSEPGMDKCTYCGVSFRDGETASVVTLPGGSATAKLHPSCRNSWSLANAKKCAHCRRPMPTDVTTLTGAWGSADVHPDCVASFKAAGKFPEKSPSTSPQKSQCYHCQRPFSVKEPMTILELADLEKEVYLHDGCVEGCYRAMGHICNLCNGTISGRQIKLKGTFGEAMLHPHCLLEFKRINNLV
eukprot:TRINITY_DN24021_c0_g1_i1.p1 TRINITY_DN24021_c0_g1~~TRINITY_DN24021_c0_g1_i1.p1  ORF type:complete len:589 (+),score=138.05 TRINITY_DN24021_c0_g1_i1:35-1801(+)